MDDMADVDPCRVWAQLGIWVAEVEPLVLHGYIQLLLAGTQRKEVLAVDHDVEVARNPGAPDIPAQHIVWQKHAAIMKC
jgi:hypothetical protein